MTRRHRRSCSPHTCLMEAFSLASPDSNSPVVKEQGEGKLISEARPGPLLPCPGKMTSRPGRTSSTVCLGQGKVGLPVVLNGCCSHEDGCGWSGRGCGWSGRCRSSPLSILSILAVAVLFPRDVRTTNLYRSCCLVVDLGRPV